MQDSHSILRLWTRSAMDGPLVEHDSLELIADRGVEGDHGIDGRRHVTIVFLEDWRGAERDLGVAVDPAARRANVLVSGGGGEAYVGRTIWLGGAEIRVLGIVAPCPVMERGAKGLEAALKPAGRGGIWGRIAKGARIARGDSLRALAASAG